MSESTHRDSNSRRSGIESADCCSAADFMIHQLRGLRANVTGLGPLSWVINRLQRTLLNTFGMYIQDFLQVSKLKL